MGDESRRVSVDATVFHNAVAGVVQVYAHLITGLVRQAETQEAAAGHAGEMAVKLDAEVTRLREENRALGERLAAKEAHAAKLEEELRRQEELRRHSARSVLASELKSDNERLHRDLVGMTAENNGLRQEMSELKSQLARTRPVT